ncbi:MAG: hypothetical protein IJ083_12325 [Clostridia bacterium]|nr:hypothetical protein [Clostridia bacterium]
MKMFKMNRATGLVILVLALVLCAALAISLAMATGDNAVQETEEALVPDLDLSVLSGTVVYSQVYNLMYEPESYLGKVIKISGLYSSFEDAERGVVYHACIIPDATACCTQGIEFVWAGDHVWPDEYKEDGTGVVVTGTLAMYEEDGYDFLHLVDSEVIWDT